MKEERIQLTQDHGNAKKGEIFVRGDLSHGVPDYHKATDDNPTEWYWAENSTKDELRFLYYKTINPKGK